MVQQSNIQPNACELLLDRVGYVSFSMSDLLTTLHLIVPAPRKPRLHQDHHLHTAEVDEDD